ncbi:hypothetical protein AAG602_08295 [Citromicrobium bathyomarinum]
MEQHRFEDAIAVTDILIEHYPKDVHAVLLRGAAYGELIRTEFMNPYPVPAMIPPPLRPRYSPQRGRL